MPMPVYQSQGALVVGLGAVSPAWPTHQMDDVALLIVESANQAVTLSTPAGFVEVTNSPQGIGTAGGIDATRLTVFWCRATGAAMGAPTVADPGDHVLAIIATFRGCISTGNPWDVTAGDTLTPESASVTIPGATTTVADCLVAAIAVSGRDVLGAQYSAWANADLSSVTEILDHGDNTGGGGTIGAAAGGKAVAGAYGATTATLAGVTNSVQGRMSIALKPPSVGGPTRVMNLTRKRRAA